MEGTLTCSCRTWPVTGGVPRFVSTHVDPENWKTASRFGEEWNDFSMLTNEYAAQFLSWIAPVTREQFPGKIVLDMGCGKGRHVIEAHRFGATEVIGVDLSHAVDAAFKNVGRLPGVHIIQADIARLPLRPVFDYAYSVGVLHHTPNPHASFDRMVEKVKPGGTVSAWVYGREGNGWIIYGINPLRALTSRLPLMVTKTIAFFFACILQAALVVFYRPAKQRPWLKRLLPNAEYLCSISGYTFQENFSIVYDHLLPGIAHYIRQEELASWFHHAGLQDVVITRRYNNSWRGFGRKPVIDAGNKTV